MARLSVLADDLSGALELACQALIGGDYLVEGVGDLAGKTGVITREAYGKIPVAYRLQRAQELALVELGILKGALAIRAANASLGYLSLHQPVSLRASARGVRAVSIETEMLRKPGRGQAVHEVG